MPNLSKDLTEQVDKALQAADARTGSPNPELGS
jgi:hypothetical protein